MLLTTRTRAYPFSKDVWGLYGICKRKAVINVAKIKRNNCGGCPRFPCSHFVNDSSISKEENEKNLKKMIDNLSEFNQ